MKRFRKYRDPRFALTTLQNPSWEVRTRAELIQAAQDALAHQPDASELVVEDVDQTRPGPDTILRAINTCACLNDRDEWVEPIKRVIVSSGGLLAAPAPESQPAPAPELHQFAPETYAHPQFSAHVRTSTDEASAIPNQRPGD